MITDLADSRILQNTYLGSSYSTDELCPHRLVHSTTICSKKQVFSRKNFFLKVSRFLKDSQMPCPEKYYFQNKKKSSSKKLFDIILISY